MFSSQKLTVRVTKADSAYFYFILEAQEGMTAYSTLPHREGEQHRDIELTFTADFRQEVDELLGRVSREIPLTVVEKSP